MSALKDGALRLAELGWAVFPCGLDKAPHPMLGDKGGFHHATLDLEQIGEWWDRDPEAWIGSPTSLAFDVDTEDGAASAARLGLDTAGVGVRTRNGWHFHFRASPDKLSNAVAGGLGLTLRGVGAAYTIMPPSPGYRWLTPDGQATRLAGLPALPEAASEVLRDGAVGGDQDQRRRDAPDDPIPEGQRHPTLVRRAVSMRKLGWSGDAILAALRIENAERCKPPLPEGELEGIVSWGGERVAPDSQGQGASSARREPSLRVVAHGQREQPADDPSLFVDWRAFWDRDRTAADWLLDNVLARGRGHSIYAPHGVGKSLLMLWVALQLVRQGVAVVYLDFEMGEDDLYERLEDMGCGEETDLALLRYALLPSLPPLDTQEGAAELLAAVDRVSAEHPDRHVALVIDTMSRAVAGDENDADTVRAFYRHTGLGLKQRGVTWARLDHAGKDPAKGQRGTSAKGDDVDVVWRLTETDDGLELGCGPGIGKRRMGWVPDRVALEKVTDPYLAFRPAPRSWPAGTSECAGDLDRLGVSPGAAVRAAQTALKDAGKGRRQAVVRAALQWRREAGIHPPDTPSGKSSGYTPERSREIPHSHGADTPPDTPGYTPSVPMGYTAYPPKGYAGSQDSSGRRPPDPDEPLSDGGSS